MKLTVFVLTVTWAALSAAQEYDVTIVSRNTAERAFDAKALAADGTVVGGSYSSNVPFSRRAATWSAGQLTVFEGYGSVTDAYAVNRRRQIAGHAQRANSAPILPAYWDPDGTFHPLTDIPDRGFALAITDARAVFGQVYTPGDTSRAFVWENGQYQYVPQLGVGPYSYAEDMNNNKVAIGEEVSREGGTHDFWAWSEADGLVRIPLYGVDINENDLIAGYRSGRALLYDFNSGALRELARGEGTFARPIALNDLGSVVGRTSREGSGIDAAILWRSANADPLRLEDLIDPALGLWITRSIAINNAGQILAYAQTPDNRDFYTVRLDPVPEPATLLALGAGLAALARRRRTKP